MTTPDADKKIEERIEELKRLIEREDEFINKCDSYFYWKTELRDKINIYILMKAMEEILLSASPNQRDHPKMFNAWQSGESAIKQARRSIERMQPIHQSNQAHLGDA